MTTPYQELTEKEQASDLVEADKYLPLITAAEQRGRKSALEEIKRFTPFGMYADALVTDREGERLTEKIDHMLAHLNEEVK